MKKSKYLSLNKKDYINSFLFAVVCAIIVGLEEGLRAVPPHFPATWADWQVILIAGVLAGIASLGKKGFTNSEGKLFKKETQVA